MSDQKNPPKEPKRPETIRPEKRGSNPPAPPARDRTMNTVRKGNTDMPGARFKKA